MALPIQNASLNEFTESNNDELKKKWDAMSESCKSQFKRDGDDGYSLYLSSEWHKELLRKVDAAIINNTEADESINSSKLSILSSPEVSYITLVAMVFLFIVLQVGAL